MLKKFKKKYERMFFAMHEMTPGYNIESSIVYNPNTSPDKIVVRKANG